MNRKWFLLGVGVLIGGLLVGAATTPTTGAATTRPSQVEVVNFPNPQNVAGTVQVSNFPASQAVTGTVNVGNFPAVQSVTGETSVSNLPLDAQGELRVAGISDLNSKLSTVGGGSGHRFVGVTSATTAGSAGWKGMSDMCRGEFGTR